MSKPVIVGYIRTPEGEAALTAAVAESRLRSAPLIIVHSAKGGSENFEEVTENREALEALKVELTSAGVDVRIDDLVRGNDPASDLIEVADSEDAALIVIGMRRRSPVGKLLLGSNAQGVLLHANCPALTVKAD